MVISIFSQIDFVKQIYIFSEKCGEKEIDKLTEDFAKDLISSRTTKAKLERYLKNSDKAPEILAIDNSEEVDEIKDETENRKES